VDSEIFERHHGYRSFDTPTQGFPCFDLNSSTESLAQLGHADDYQHCVQILNQPDSGRRSVSSCS